MATVVRTNVIGGEVRASKSNLGQHGVELLVLCSDITPSCGAKWSIYRGRTQDKFVQRSNLFTWAHPTSPV